MTEVFVVLHVDRHIDPIVNVFSTEEKAVAFARELFKKMDRWETVVENLKESLTRSNLNAGIRYQAFYGEDDTITVLMNTLDEGDA